MSNEKILCIDCFYLANSYTVENETFFLCKFDLESPEHDDSCNTYISTSEYTRNFLLKNLNILFEILTEVSDEDITKLREFSAREIDSRVKKKIAKYLNKINQSS